MEFRAAHILLCIFWCIVLIVGMFGLVFYPGSKMIYVLFTIFLNALLVLGFTRGRIYFDTFIGIFFWLGFWLKYSVRTIFFGGDFQAPELIGKFGGTPPEFDRALLVVICGISGLLIASFIRRRFLFSYNDTGARIRFEATFTVYQRYRKLILTAFFCLIVVVSVSNLALGIYQRGTLPKTILPLGLSGVYTWLLLFGLASFSAVILDYEFRLKKEPYLAGLIGIAETFFSNVSILSRGMVLNGSSLLIGMRDTSGRRSMRPGIRYKLIVLGVFMTMFLASVFITNEVRERLFYSDFSSRTNISKSFLVRMTFAKLLLLFGIKAPEPVVEAIAGVETLVIDRWIGIEGVMSMVGHRQLGWGLWKEAWGEKYSHSGTSMYDLKILGASQEGLKHHHFISIPGIVAFFYYPGSMIFLLTSMVLLGVFAAGLEFLAYRLSDGNLILCALFGQVIAYRYAHFGYVPAQSYLLFGSLVLNLLIIYFSGKFLSQLTKGSGQ